MSKNFVEYKEYINVFWHDLIIELPENMRINKHVINLVGSKQLLYKLIYNLSFVELEIRKTYIQIYLKTRFLGSLKSLIGASILFHKKSDSNLWLYINYRGLNNLRIKNWYFLLLISKFPDQLGQTKCFV